jgi:uncharacterized protein (DUF58 family)
MRVLQVLVLLAVALAFALATGNEWVISAMFVLALVLLLALVQRRTVQAQVHVVTVTRPASVVPWGGVITYRVQLRAGLLLRLVQPAVAFLVEPDERGLLGQPLGQLAAQVHAGWHDYAAEEVPCLDRGRWTVGPVVAVTSGLFGLLPARREEVLPACRVLVLPRFVEIATCALLEHDGLRPGDGLSRRRDQEPPVTIGCRQYAPGDPLKRIHWPQTARQGALMSRLYESPPLRQASFYLLLDLEGEPGRRHTELLVTCATTLAVLLGDARRSTRQLGLVVGGVTGWIAPAAGSYGAGAGQLKEILAEARAGDEAPLALQLAWLGTALQPGDVAVLITAADVEGRAGVLGALQTRGVQARVIQVVGGAAEADGWPVPSLTVPAELADPHREDELVTCLEGEQQQQTSARLYAVRAAR